MNAPDRHESYILHDGQKKLEYKADERVPDAGTFTFNKEGHTAGELLRMQLLRDHQVQYAGYQLCGINQCFGCTKSFLGNDAAVLAQSGGEEPASPRHRAGVTRRKILISTQLTTPSARAASSKS